MNADDPPPLNIEHDKTVLGDEVHGDKVAGDKNVYHGPAYPRPDYRSDISNIIDFYTKVFVGRGDEISHIAAFAAQEAIAPIRRFLLGDKCYELMHLQLRKVVQEAFNNAEIAEYRHLLLSWCKRYQESGWPQDTPIFILSHYARHLAHNGDKLNLYRLVDKRWMQIKFERTFTYASFAEDVALAIDISATGDSLQDLLHLIRSGFVYAVLGTLVQSISPQFLGLLAWLGHVRRAFGYAVLIPDAPQRYVAHLFILKNLHGKIDPELVQTIWASACQAFLKIERRRSRIALRTMIFANLKTDETWISLSLATVAIALASVGLTVHAHEVVEQAITVAKAIDGARNQVRVLDEVAIFLGEAGQTAQAITVAKAIDGARNQVRVLGQIAKALAAAGLSDQSREVTEQAITTAQAIVILVKQGQALAEIAKAFAVAGLSEQALAAARAIDGARNQVRSLGEIAKAFATAGQIAKVHAAVRVNAAANTAANAPAAGRLDKQTLTALDISEVSNQVRVPHEVGNALDTTGFTEQTREAAEQVLAIMRPIAYTDKWVRMLVEVAKALAAARLADQAHEVAEEAFAKARTIPKTEDQVQALGDFTRILITVGLPEQARQAAELAIAAAQVTRNSDKRVWVLCKVAKALASVGLDEQARNAIEEARATAQAIADADNRAFMLTEIAKAFTAANLTEEMHKSAGQTKQALTAAWTIAGTYKVLGG